MEARTTTLANAPSLEERAYRIRRNALRMGEVQGQGYIAQALGVAESVNALKDGKLEFDGPPKDIDNDRFRMIYGEDAVEVEIA